MQVVVHSVCFLMALTQVGFGSDSQTRPVQDDAALESWLQNMVWHHRYSSAEISRVTGLSETELTARLRQSDIRTDNAPPRPKDRLFVLPYPGGRHPRIGFLDGAVDPQRETKLSVFAPWDDTSYAVMDVPEAIWSNLGLTYLAHTHVETLWTKQDITLPQLEWQIDERGHFTMQRILPNGIIFGTKVIPLKDHLRMKMWITNGTEETLSDLRIQNCVMLKGMAGFDQQTNDNKQFADNYAVARSETGNRWLISAWDPPHRTWGNAPCPCLHSDPKFEDCPPGETRFLRGWFSFYQGTDINGELKRIEATGWRTHPLHHVTGNVSGRIIDSESGRLIPARLYAQNTNTGEWHTAASTAVAGAAIPYDRQRGPAGTHEVHTALSADPFQLNLPPGTYRLRAERGKEYIPAESVITVSSESERKQIELRLRRFTDMAKAGWYSGDTHVHRSMDELPVVVQAEDLNVALPLNYWVRDSAEIPSAGDVHPAAEIVMPDSNHLIYPVNTEYEIFTVRGQRHTQGAVFVLNHKTPLSIPAPPVRPITDEARRQGALLDLDKHSWNWSLMIIPVMKVDLFELSNNHHWRSQFGFPAWTVETAPDWPEIERDADGFTESGWTEFGMQTYYTLLNCGFRMRVSAGTASGVHPVPLGHGRVYVHCGDTFDYDTWIRNLNAGHSFVTQGPLMNVRFNDTLPGTTTTSGTLTNRIRVSGTIQSLRPLSSAELVVNGQVSRINTESRQQDGVWVSPISCETELTGSGWTAVRCFEEMSDRKVSFAHTNPVFIDVPDHPLRPRKERVRYFAERMNEEIARNEGILPAEAVAEFREARDIYEELLRTAR